MRWLIAGAASALLPLCAAAAVQTDIGVLICTLAESGERVETPPSQTRAMVCSFKPSGTGPEERYSGEIRKVGSQDALSGKLVLIWVVMGPADRALTPGLLEQTYMGELAASSEDRAKSPSMLVGERDHTYALRPMTHNGAQDGADAAAVAGGITVVVLKVQSIPS